MIDDHSDAQRYPTLSAHGQAMLDFLREHPHAPRYRNQSGNRLTSADLERVRAAEREARAPLYARDLRAPRWLDAFIEHCYANVPFRREHGSRPRDFLDIPTTARADLSRDVAQFVPDDVPVERMIMFQTSSTTGHPLTVASHPIVAANYLAIHKRALRRFGVVLRHGRGQVGCVLLGFQRRCFTYVSVTPTMSESGLAKINLHPDDWRDPRDREQYLDALSPEIIAGEPISFCELLRIPTTCRPRALLSTSMALSAQLAQRLRERFECPVLDLYSMNEAGPIAVYDPALEGHVLLQPNLFVEVVDAEGLPLPEGARGEVTLTGGFNFCLPLLRYRTGDQASLHIEGEDVVLRGLTGRPPVQFRTSQGGWLNNVDVTHCLQRFAIGQYSLHQRADGRLLFRCTGHALDLADVRAALLELFGADQAIDLEFLPEFTGKIVQYTSELTPEAIAPHGVQSRAAS